MKYGFVAKHRGIWPVVWVCEMLDVSRSGFYEWFERPASARAQANAAMTMQICTSFIDSDRTYGARRVWHDLQEWGLACGLYQVERLMKSAALRARPKRHASRTM